MGYLLAIAVGWLALLAIDALCDVAQRFIDGRRR
jgi:hypothetical protein